MLVFDAEGGTVGVTPTTGDTGSGDAPTAILSPPAGGLLEYTNALAAHGTKSVRAATRGTAGTAGLEWTNASAAASWNGRGYFGIDGALGSSMAYVTCRTSAGVLICTIGLATAGTHWRLTQGSGGTTVWTSTASFSTSTMYRVEWQVITNGTTAGTAQIRLFDASTETLIEDSTAIAITIASAVTTWDQMRVGQLTSAINTPSASADVYADDLALFGTDWIGAAAPTASGRVPGRSVAGWF